MTSGDGSGGGDRKEREGEGGDNGELREHVVSSIRAGADDYLQGLFAVDQRREC